MSTQLPSGLTTPELDYLTQDNLLELARVYAASLLQGSADEKTRVLASVFVELDQRLTQGGYSPTDWEKEGTT